MGLPFLRSQTNDTPKRVVFPGQKSHFLSIWHNSIFSQIPIKIPSLLRWCSILGEIPQSYLDFLALRNQLQKLNMSMKFLQYHNLWALRWKEWEQEMPIKHHVQLANELLFMHMKKKTTTLGTADHLLGLVNFPENRMIVRALYSQFPSFTQKLGGEIFAASRTLMSNLWHGLKMHRPPRVWCSGSTTILN